MSVAKIYLRSQAENASATRSSRPIDQLDRLWYYKVDLVEATVEEIAISKFKATCLGVLERVRKTKTPVRITRRGQPVAEVVPPSADKNHARFGFMAGSFEICGDIVSPVIDVNDFEVLRD